MLGSGEWIGLQSESHAHNRPLSIAHMCACACTHMPKHSHDPLDRTGCLIATSAYRQGLPAIPDNTAFTPTYVQHASAREMLTRLPELRPADNWPQSCALPFGAARPGLACVIGFPAKCGAPTGFCSGPAGIPHAMCTTN